MRPFPTDRCSIPNILPKEITQGLSLTPGARYHISTANNLPLCQMWGTAGAKGEPRMSRTHILSILFTNIRETLIWGL